MGDLMETLNRSESILMRGISEINDRGDINASNLELLGDAVDTLKDIYTIREKAQGGNYGYYDRDSRGRFMYDGNYRNWEDKEHPRYANEMDRDVYRRRMEQM